MMKKLFFLFLLSLSSSLKAQQYYTFIVFVTDNDLRPIANVQITIKECGWCSKYTGVDGKAVFEKSLSAGNIHYIVSKEGYQYQQSEYNITTEEKSNPKHIVLSAQRNQNDKFLIMGTVLDKSKNTIPSASIEVEYGGGKVSTMSDAFGFFSAEMQKNALYQSGKIINVKAAYGSCRKVEIIDFPASSVIRLNLQMECAISALTNAVNNEELLYQKVMSKLSLATCIEYMNLYPNGRYYSEISTRRQFIGNQMRQHEFVIDAGKPRHNWIPLTLGTGFSISGLVILGSAHPEDKEQIWAGGITAACGFFFLIAELCDKKFKEKKREYKKAVREYNKLAILNPVSNLRLESKEYLSRNILTMRINLTR